MNTNVRDLTNTVVSDEDLMFRLENAESSQEVSDLLAEKGIKITPEAIDEFMNQEVFSKEELSEEDLERIAGGKFKLRYLNPVYWVGRLLAAAVTKDMC